MFELRPYQTEAKQAVLSQWDEGHKKTLLVLPTGTGKTVVFSAITQEQVQKKHRVLIIAHRMELLTQAADKLKAASGLDAALEKGESHSLGVTATPDRGDKQKLGTFFDSLAYEYSMNRAIREKYLAPIKAQLIPLKLDISPVQMANGDFSANDIGYALEPYLYEIAMQMKKYCQGHKTVVFLPLVATSQKFCRILNDFGMRAVEVNGNSDDRTEILSDFENGKYDILCNAMLLTEGWDCPSVDCVVVLRPTKVRSLYQQMVGLEIHQCTKGGMTNWSAVMTQPKGNTTGYARQ